MLKRPNGILTHGSLEAGENSVHSVRYREFYPFSIPLEEPRHERSSVESLSPRLLESSKRVLSLFLKSETTMKPLSLAESELSGEASHQPWRGYWWPNKGLPMLRPLEKFEGFAAARGRNLQATEWESSHHVSHGLWWEGHCNGWAAASILRPEPRSSDRKSTRLNSSHT